ncbi:MAG: pilus assembly protein [Desulfobacterales bacterium]|nr:MAG: pilus assembly protein [Desulfobacterales bacterium]
MKAQFESTIRSYLSPIRKYLDDPAVSEVMINSPSEIWIEIGGQISRVPETFESEEALMSAVNNISQFVHRSISQESPRLDARLPDGSRVHIIIPPCSKKGICVTIRKFSKDILTVEKLVGYGSITEDAVAFLGASVQLKKNILVSGGTGSGKTSLLNALSSLIPDEERIIVIEDSSELQLQKEHVVLLETKMADKKGQGEVSIRDLLHSSLRMRPDRIIIGELRGGEALDFLQAMNTGHGGSMGTVHANNPEDTLARLETLTLYSGVDLPLKAVRKQIASAIDIIVQTSRYSDGSRKISQITEVVSLERDEYETRDLFSYRQEGLDENGKVTGFLQISETPPSFYHQYEQGGIALPQSLLSCWSS